MTRLLLILAAAVLALPAAALAKGALTASVTGPGAGDSITLTGPALDRFSQQAGFPAAVFGHRDPDPMLRARPRGDLGPKYTITYTVPGPDNDQIQLRQDVYPYATPVPVTYLRPGLKVFRGMTTHGGWFQASPALKQTLVTAGLPATAGRGDGGDVFPTTAAISALALATALLGAAAAAVLVRRRLRHAPAA